MKQKDLGRFNTMYVVLDNGCWQWIRGKGKAGYGHFWLDGKTRDAHVVSYNHYVGPVPKGKVLDHFKCDNRACCNYEHVKPVTKAANTMRGNGVMAVNARKTHCPKGHRLSGKNVRIADGRRHCRACRKLMMERKKVSA